MVDTNTHPMRNMGGAALKTVTSNAMVTGAFEKADPDAIKIPVPDLINAFVLAYCEFEGHASADITPDNAYNIDGDVTNGTGGAYTIDINDIDIKPGAPLDADSAQVVASVEALPTDVAGDLPVVSAKLGTEQILVQAGKVAAAGGYAGDALAGLKIKVFVIAPPTLD